MANVIRYKTSQPTKRGLRKGNTVVGTGEENYGPTSTTGYVNGITPPDGGYVVYILSSNNDPAIYVANNDNDLIAIANTIGGSVSTVANAKTYLAGRSNTIMLDSVPKNTDTENLLFHFDFTEPYCYPGNGVVYYDLSGNNYHASASSNTSYVEYDSNLNVVDFKGGEVDGHGLFVQDLNYVTGNSDQLEELTIDTLIKASTLSNNSSDQRIILSFDRSAVFRFSIGGDAGMTTSNPGKLSFMSIQTGDQSATNCPDLRDDKWHKITVTFKSGTGNGLRYYVDGELVHTDTSTYNPIGEHGENESPRYGVIGAGSEKDNDTPGSSTAPDSIFTGSMASIKYYSKQLSQSEILQNYYGGPIITDGLIFALDAGNLVSYESGSTIAYSMTGSYSASLDNGVGFRQDNGGVFYFDGSDDIITGPNINPPSITVEVWKKWTTVSDDWLITNQVAPTDSSKGYYIRIDSPSYAMRFYAGTGGSAKVVATTIELNKWYHVVGNIDANSTNLYVNGELVSTTSGGTIDYTGVQGLTIGADNTNQRDTPGPVGPIRIYDRALTAEEVLQNFNAQKARFL